MALFQRRHYEALAELMQDLKPADNESYNKRQQHNRTIVMLSAFLQRDNTSFDATRFEKACFSGANVRARK